MRILRVRATRLDERVRGRPRVAASARRERNEAVVRDWLEALARGDTDAAQRLLADDAVIHAPGASGRAREIVGFDGTAAWLAQRSEGTVDARSAPHDVLSSEAHVVVLSTIHHADAERITRQVAVYHVAGARISEVWIHEDHGAA